MGPLAYNTFMALSTAFLSNWAASATSPDFMGSADYSRVFSIPKVIEARIIQSFPVTRNIGMVVVLY